MTATPITAKNAGMPNFPVPAPASDSDVFALSSHARAREALELGLQMREQGFNVFVVGDDRSGRMSATLDFLQDEMAKRSAPSDWIYVNNFRRTHRPKPIALPAGIGREFRGKVEALIPQIREGLAHAFGEESAQAELRKEQEALAAEISKRLEAIRVEAIAAGLDLSQTPQGMQVVRAGGEEAPDWMSLPEEDRRQIEAAGRDIGQKLADFNRWAAEQQKAVAERAQGMSKTIAEDAISSLVDGVKVAFTEHPSLAKWLDELKADAVDKLGLFAPQQPGQPPAPGYEPPERRYAVN
ncbi:MAG: Lon-like protease helical domain-containing protein, partial [Alphaproteobacteria bacterium]